MDLPLFLSNSGAHVNATAGILAEGFLIMWLNPHPSSSVVVISNVWICVMVIMGNAWVCLLVIMGIARFSGHLTFEAGFTSFPLLIIYTVGRRFSDSGKQSLSRTLHLGSSRFLFNFTANDSSQG
ncbi:hypothetical protein CDAR_246391 [Caerostris darwini]|uniref:Uncharacterized protein n=1 Tax=Caerostris darwini TaxID=1538125 RepID=A0AAV4W647_9ARAC|nr:hypothetical protein CDAR_246391 [Caerostris darwini]